MLRFDGQSVWVKKGKKTYEDPDTETVERQGSIQSGIQRTIVSVLAEQWPQCGQGGSRVGDQATVVVPVGQGAPARLEMQATIRRLTEENAKLLEQREVLKKSLGILSEAPPRSMPKSNK